MRLKDAVKLRVLIALYAASRTLALLFESPRARRLWGRLLLPLFGGWVLVFGVLAIPCGGGQQAAFELVGSKPSSGDAPFFERVTPKREVGDLFTYERHPGYQVGMSFAIDQPETIHSATLRMVARVRTRGHLEGTEAIWVDGILSGKPFERFVDRRNVREDISDTNHTFSDRIDECCRRKWGKVEFDLTELLDGARTTTVEEILADGRLDVVIADDTEVFVSELVVCRDAAKTDCTSIFQPVPHNR